MSEKADPAFPGQTACIKLGPELPSTELGQRQICPNGRQTFHRLQREDKSSHHFLSGLP